MVSWRYDPPYDFYDGDVDPVLNPERFFAVRDESGALVGFYYFEQKDDVLEYGLGLRPELTGRGLGLEFFRAGLDFARHAIRRTAIASTSPRSTSARSPCTSAPASARLGATCGRSNASETWNSWTWCCGVIEIAPEVRDVRDGGVVALETTLVAHGFPPGEGVAVGLESERRVRERRRRSRRRSACSTVRSASA